MIEIDILPLVHDDPVVASLNGKIGKLYDSYYEFNSHGMACWFNEDQEKLMSGTVFAIRGAIATSPSPGPRFVLTTAQYGSRGNAVK